MQDQDQYQEDLGVAIRFHGHICPGLVIGYRAALAALAYLDVERPEDEDLVAIVESDGCGIDGIQAILGCTIGKGNLIYKDHGKQVYTVISRKGRRAVRIALRAGAFRLSPEQESLFGKIWREDASEEEKKAFRAFQKERVEELLGMEDDALFTVAQVSPEIPARARIFKSAICGLCGEPVMEPRARVRDGKAVCIPCSESYSRGW